MNFLSIISAFMRFRDVLGPLFERFDGKPLAWWNAAEEAYELIKEKYDEARADGEVTALEWLNLARDATSILEEADVMPEEWEDDMLEIIVVLGMLESFLDRDQDGVTGIGALVHKSE